MCITCDICGKKMNAWDNAKIMGKYSITYWRCPECGYIKTDTPYWLDEAYSSAIGDSDIGLPSRNIWLSEITSAVIKCCFPNKETFLDFGGGYGLFVRLMRDKGFSFEWYDKYCDNLFSKTFCKSRLHYDIITAYEVFEHLSNPMKDLEEIFSFGNNIIFSTSLIPDNVKKINDWWYFCTETGQHISFYTKESMKKIANNFGVNYMGYGDVHILSKEKISAMLFFLSYKMPAVVNFFLRRDSYLMKDYEIIRNRILEENGSYDRLGQKDT